MRKIGLALGSGGSKGAYQAGFFIALQELGMTYQVVTGASIGALNGALAVQGEINLMIDLWRNIDIKKVMKYGVNLDLEEILKSDKKTLLKFLASYVLNRGIDITPFEQFLEQYLNVEKIMESPIPFGVTVASFPQLKGYDINIKETLRKDVLSYLMASASCFPAFPVTVINGGQYIDGAYHDRLPIDLCFKLGADHVIAVDLNNQAVSHPEYVNDANVTYIHSYNSLGAFMMIKKDVIERNITLGYHDTLKAFRKYIGFLYTFYPDSQHDEEGKKLALKLEDKKLRKVKSLLIDGVRGPITDRGVFIRMLEILADKLNIETTKIYKIEELISLIDDEIKVGSRADEIMLLKPAQRHFQLSSMKLNTQFGLIKQMKNDNLIFDEAMSDLFDEEYPILSVCALFYGLV